MKIAFVVNDVQTELATYTTTRLAMAATNRGHKSYTFGVGDFICTCEGAIHALAHTVRAKSYKSLDKYLAELQSPDQAAEHVNLDEFDVVMLRNDPSTDAQERPWAQSSGILFGQLAAKRGV